MTPSGDNRLEDQLARAVARWPDKIALVSGEHRLSYRQLGERVERLAGALQMLDIQRGDRIVLWMPTGPELVIAIYATLRCGAAFVVLDPTMKSDRVAYIVRDCDAAGVFLPTVRATGALTTLAETSPVMIAVGKATAGVSIPTGVADYEQLLAGGYEHVPVEGIDRDLACLVYTSGSTGEPKGVMSAHHNVTFAAHSITTCLGTSSDDIVISPLPLSFDYGLYQLLMTVSRGATLVLEPFAYPAAFLERLALEGATTLPGVPTMWAMLLGMDLTAFELSSLRTLTNTGAALPPAHIKKLLAALPQARMFSMYGLTETKRTLIMPPDELANRPDSVGIAIPGTEVWLEGADGQRLGVGEVGELMIRGGHVMLGYWNDPVASAARFPPGPLPGERLCRSGDLFRRDNDGYYYFVSRRDDVLKSRGQKVAPKHVEAVLHDLDGVQEAAVVGVHDETLGQAICAYVVCTDANLTAVAVLRHCRQHLADFEVPQSVVFVEELPKSAHGKVARSELTGPDH